MFCAKNNLGLRGHTEEFGQRDNGVFLSTFELLAKHDIVLAKHMEKHTKGCVSYLSHTIQDELIELMGNYVKNQILTSVTNSKYYSVILDSTPDVSHTDQLSVVIRYVLNTDGRYVIKESFIDFVRCGEKTGAGLAEKLCSILEDAGLNFGNMRG